MKILTEYFTDDQLEVIFKVLDLNLTTRAIESICNPNLSSEGMCAVLYGILDRKLFSQIDQIYPIHLSAQELYLVDGILLHYFTSYGNKYN